MKTVSIVVACYNEQDNVIPLYDAIRNIFLQDLNMYNYRVLFMDNDSSDLTRERIKQLCYCDSDHVSAIFNTHNVGSVRSSVYGMLHVGGDCVVKMCADFQDPPELLVDFVKEWEAGNRIVLGIKKTSKENKIMYGIRRLYYKLIQRITDIDHIDNFVGYGLYDRQFIDIIRQLDDPMPYLRGIVAELGYKYKPIYYVQPARRSGKSKFNFARLYDYAMLGVTSYSKVPLRLATFFGSLVAFISIIIGIVYLIYKLMYWDKFNGGIAPVLLGVFFIGAIQLISLGLIGEYVLSINTRVIHRPMVVEEMRMNLPNILTKEGKLNPNEASNNACITNESGTD